MSLLRPLAPLLALALIGLALPPPAHAGGQRQEMAAELGLTEAQLAQMKEIQFAGKTARISIKARLDIARAELRHALGAATLDDAAIARALAAADAAGSELLKSRTDQAIALRKVFTPEQWAKAAALHDEDEDEDEDEDDDDDRHHDREREHGDGPRHDEGAPDDAPSGHADCDGTHCQDCDDKGKAGKQRGRGDGPGQEPENEPEDHDRWGDD